MWNFKKINSHNTLVEIKQISESRSLLRELSYYKSHQKTHKNWVFRHWKMQVICNLETTVTCARINDLKWGKECHIRGNLPHTCSNFLEQVCGRMKTKIWASPGNIWIYFRVWVAKENNSLGKRSLDPAAEFQ